MAIKQCRRAGFRKVLLRGDTDFSQTKHLDRWDDDDVKFIFGFDCNKTVKKITENLPKSVWKPLERTRRSVPASKQRRKRENEKEKIVVAIGYKNKRLQEECYAEFRYQPAACNRSYRMVVVRKLLRITKGGLFLHNEYKYFFYISNELPNETSSRAIINGANNRCNQENTISQLVACGALKAPLSDLRSNNAYMLFASLAWNLKQWLGMTVRVKGNEGQRRVRRQTRDRVIKMEYWTFMNQVMTIPAQVIRSSRRRCFRLLTYRDAVDLLMTLHDHVNLPLRC
ncbi:MAG: transposase [Planctomycetota bacterium]